MIKFSIHQGMKSGQYEQSIRKYKKIQGTSGTWYVAIQDNIADNIYVDSHDPKSQGFGGATLEFQLEDGTTEQVKGPWHSNSNALFNDTGYDVRDKSLTRGIVAKSMNYDKSDFIPIYTDVLHYDEQPVIGNFYRIQKIAEKFSKELKCNIYYAVISSGGGSSSWVEYKEEES